MNQFKIIYNDLTEEVCSVEVEFDIGPKKYALCQNSKKEFIPIALIDNKPSVVTNETELEAIKNVLDALKNDIKEQELVDAAPIFYNGVKYDTLFDVNNKYRYFYELIDGHYHEIAGDLKNTLDSIYNMQPETLFSGDALNKFNKATKKIFKLGTVVIIVLIVGQLTFQTLSVIDLKKDFNTNVSQIVQMYQVDENDAQLILNYIEDNIHISNEDKDFLMSMEHFYHENEAHFEMKAVKANIRNMQLIYDKDNQKAHNLPERVRGAYTKGTGKVKIFVSDKFDNELVTKQVMFHEFMHVISNKGYVANSSFGLALTEGMNELLAEEYLGTYSETYPKLQTYARIFSEILGTDVMRNSFFQSDIEQVTKALTDIAGDKKAATRFITLLDDEARAEATLMTSTKEREIEDAKKTIAFVEPQIDKYISFYYKMKFNEPVENSELMVNYLDSLRFTNNSNSSYFVEGNMDKIIVVKHYFNSELIAKEPNVHVQYKYKDGVTRQVKNEDIEKLANGKFRRHFANGQFIDYDKDPRFIKYKSANYSFMSAPKTAGKQI